VNGNAYSGMLCKGLVETCMGSSEKNQNKPAQAFPEGHRDDVTILFESA